MPNLARAITIADLRVMAKRRLPEFAFVPVDNGSGDGSGPVRNVDAFRRRTLTARALIDVKTVRQGVTVFGQAYASPFGISAVGHANRLRRHADQMLAEAAAEANIPFMLSGGSTASIEEVARIAPNHVWQQLYFARDRAITEDIVKRGRDAGVRVLVYTADNPVPPRNDWLARTGIALPAYVPLRAWPYVLWQAAKHPSWSFDHGLRGPKLESWAPYAPPGSSAITIGQVVHRNVPTVQTWADLEMIRRIWPGKLVVKGLVDAGDALRAIDCGVDAVIVSNHGGNKLDSMAAAIDELPAIVRAVKSQTPIFFDSGIRKGSDILVALALGAEFTFVGRAPLYGVIAGGLEGARRSIAILQEEIERTLALIGCPGVDAINASILHKGDQ